MAVGKMARWRNYLAPLCWVVIVGDWQFLGYSFYFAVPGFADLNDLNYNHHLPMSFMIVEDLWHRLQVDKVAHFLNDWWNETTTKAFTKWQLAKWRVDGTT